VVEKHRGKGRKIPATVMGIGGIIVSKGKKSNPKKIIRGGMGWKYILQIIETE